MVAMPLLSGPAGPMTRAELDALPDDGYRHELIDGVLVVSPAPRRPHQRLLTKPAYVEVANIGAGESWTAELPFRVTIDPGALT